MALASTERKSVFASHLGIHFCPGFIEDRPQIAEAVLEVCLPPITLFQSNSFRSFIFSWDESVHKGMIKNVACNVEVIQSTIIWNL